MFVACESNPREESNITWFWMLDVVVEQKQASPWLILGYSSVLLAFKTRSLLSKCCFLCPFLKFSSIIWPVQLIIKRTPRYFSEFISVSLHWMFSGKKVCTCSSRPPPFPSTDLEMVLQAPVHKLCFSTESKENTGKHNAVTKKKSECPLNLT